MNNRLFAYNPLTFAGVLLSNDSMWVIKKDNAIYNKVYNNEGKSVVENPVLIKELINI